MFLNTCTSEEVRNYEDIQNHLSVESMFVFVLYINAITGFLAHFL